MKRPLFHSSKPVLVPLALALVWPVGEAPVEAQTGSSSVSRTRRTQTRTGRRRPSRARSGRVRLGRNAPQRALVITPLPGFRSATGTHSVDPRADGATGNPRTGDIRFITEPEDARVFYYIAGGSAAEPVLKNLRPRRTLVVVAAPDRRARFNAYVPVTAGHITTVRLVLPEAPPPRIEKTECSRGPAAHEERLPQLVLHPGLHQHSRP